jgi:hypothetical protein
MHKFIGQHQHSNATRKEVFRMQQLWQRVWLLHVLQAQQVCWGLRQRPAAKSLPKSRVSNKITAVHIIKVSTAVSAAIDQAAACSKGDV